MRCARVRRRAQFDGEGRRAAAPRFDAQPVQGVSSIKPGTTAGAWWALSDNGFGGKWNSSDYRLCIYLFDVRPRTEAGGDSRNALQAVIELSDPAKFFPWRLADENSPERLLTGLDADPESLVTMPDESFWIGDEFGPWLLHFSIDGELLAPPVELPDNVRSADHPLAITRADIPRLPHSRGLEAMDLAGDNKTLVSILEGTVGGDAPRTLRVQRYDTAAGKWLPGTLIYELDPDTISVTDMSLIEGNRFVVIERDDQQGDAARAKRVYSIDLDRALPGKPLQKKLVIDLLSIGNARGLAVTAPGAPFRFPYLTTESIQVLDRKHVVIVNDNNYPATGGRGACRQGRHRMDLARTRQSFVSPVTLIALKNAELAFGLHPLLDGASIAIQAGDRVGLIGRNGTGKSSLLSALLGKIPLDAGEVQRRPGLVHRERRAGAGAAARRNAARVAGAARRFREHARRPRVVGARSAAQRIPAAVLGKSRCIAGLGVRRRAQARRARAGVRDDARPHAAR